MTDLLKRIWTRPSSRSSGLTAEADKEKAFFYKRVNFNSDDDELSGTFTHNTSGAEGEPQTSAIELKVELLDRDTTTQQCLVAEEVIDADVALERLNSRSAAAEDAPSANNLSTEADDDLSGKVGTSGGARAQAADRRTLFIYAVPLGRDKVVFLPVAQWREDPAALKGWRGKVNEQVEQAKSQLADRWQAMKESEPGTVANKLYQIGQRILESSSPEERLMRSIPKHVTKVVIYHPSQMTADQVMDQIREMSSSYGLQAAGRAAVAGLMLPIAFGIDIIVIPGPQVLTYYTLWEMYKNTNGALGTQRLTRYVQQDGTAERVRVNYAGDARLDPFVEHAQHNSDGLLSEDDIEDLCEQLGEPDLVQPLLELRRRELRSLCKGGTGYVQLAGHGPED